MWPFRDKGEPRKIVEADDRLVWLEVGEGNPFDAPILDIRAITLNLVSATKDQSIAENYTRSRTSDGREFIGLDPASPASFETEIRYPHDGSVLEGVVFKSPAMEVKWDIYAYGEWFYFVRSWTSELIYKAQYRNIGECIVITKIVAKGRCTEETAQDIHSMMLTHAIGRPWPYHVSGDMQDLNENAIATAMFARFGSKATVVTRANVLNIQLVQK